nr:class I SAM-dependent methyltransferase [Actinopolymorpha cephalotaxi]
MAYLLGVEGLALLHAWAGDNGLDQRFVTARLAEIRRLLDDETLSAHPGVLVERDATGTAYQQWAAGYDDPGNGLFDLDQPVVEEILDSLPVGTGVRTAVDAACGTGRLSAPLVDRGYRVVGVDGSPDMLARARRRLPGTELLAGDLARLPVSDGSADLVVTGLALTHVADLVPVFAEFARVLRPGGDLVVSDVHHDLVLLGSVVKAVGAAGQAQLATTHRHTTADFLRAALATGFRVRRYEERPRPAAPEEPLPEATPEPNPEPTKGISDWRDWPWSLLGLVPDATRAAWNHPAVAVWHFQLG